MWWRRWENRQRQVCFVGKAIWNSNIYLFNVKYVENSIIATVVALVLSACSAETQQKTYSLDGSVDASRDGKAYLYVLLPEYQKLMLLDSVDVRHGGSVFRNG